MNRRWPLLLAALLATAPMAAAQSQVCWPCLDVAPPPSGDARLRINDVVVVLRFAAGLDVPTAEQRTRADIAPNVRDDWAESVGEVPVPVEVIGDGRIDVADVVEGLRIVVGLDSFSALPDASLWDLRPEETCLGGLVTLRGRGLVVGSHVPTVRLGDLETELVGSRRAEPPDSFDDWIQVREASGTPVGAWAPTVVDVVATTRGGLELRLDDALTIQPSCELAPTVEAMLPGYGGNSRVLRGSGLACVTEVLLRDPGSGEERPAVITGVSSDASLTIRIPEWPGADALPLDVIVRNSCGEGEEPGGLLHLGDLDSAVPELEELAPLEGPSRGGNSLMMRGPHVGLVDRVLFGSVEVPAGDLNRQAWDQLLVARVPASAAGPWVTETVPVLVSIAGREDPSPPDYTYLAEPLPECGSFSPDTGGLAGGDSVTISAALGSDLDRVDEVRFGAEPAANLLHPSASFLVVETPAYPMAADVPVELLVDGAVLSTCPMTFAYR